MVRIALVFAVTLDWVPACNAFGIVAYRDAGMTGGESAGTGMKHDSGGLRRGVRLDRASLSSPDR